MSAPTREQLGAIAYLAYVDAKYRNASKGTIDEGVETWKLVADAVIKCFINEPIIYAVSVPDYPPLYGGESISQSAEPNTLEAYLSSFVS